eukprot:4177896-Pleurochrysis_carterae.AAC.1
MPRAQAPPPQSFRTATTEYTALPATKTLPLAVSTCSLTRAFSACLPLPPVAWSLPLASASAATVAGVGGVPAPCLPAPAAGDAACGAATRRK